MSYINHVNNVNIPPYFKLVYTSAVKFSNLIGQKLSINVLQQRNSARQMIDFFINCACSNTLSFLAPHSQGLV